jgi:hypothetical protein
MQRLDALFQRSLNLSVWVVQAFGRSSQVHYESQLFNLDRAFAKDVEIILLHV